MTKSELLKYIDERLADPTTKGSVGLLMVRQYVSDNVRDVVRCKECAIRYDSCPMVVRVGGYRSFFTEDDDFCSRGRRKE